LAQTEQDQKDADNQVVEVEKQEKTIALEE